MDLYEAFLDLTQPIVFLTVSFFCLKHSPFKNDQRILVIQTLNLPEGDFFLSCENSIHLIMVIP